MLAGNAFRHQMVLPSQQFLYDYWRSKCKAGCLPSRADIEPYDIHEQLPMISLLEIHNASGRPRFRYRLAGTGFWDMYQREIQGLYLDELPIGDKQEYWNRVLAKIVNEGRPLAGVTRPNTPCKAHLAQFWIRLPLSEDGRTVSMILGFDHLVKYDELPHLIQEREKISA